MEAIVEHFFEARKSTSSSKSSSKSSGKSSSKSSHHTTYVNTGSHSGGHLPLKTELIIIGVIVGIIVAILVIYAYVHHREFKKARRAQSQDEPISHVNIGKKAALTAITFGLIELCKKKRRGNFQPVQDAEENKYAPDVPLVQNRYDGHNQYEGHNPYPYPGQTSGLYGEGGDGRRGFDPDEGHLMPDEL